MSSDVSRDAKSAGPIVRSVGPSWFPINGLTGKIVGALVFPRVSKLVWAGKSDGCDIVWSSSC